MYVCTAAERGYALEAWRLLDNRNDIIPDEVRSARIVCVPGGQKKELRRVLHVQAATKFESGLLKHFANPAWPVARSEMLRLEDTPLSMGSCLPETL